MRTAITLAVLHDGTEKLLAGRLVHLLEQKELVKKIRTENGGARWHKEYALVTYQENDGHEQQFRFLSPAQHAAREKSKAEDAANHQAANAARTNPSAPQLPEQPFDPDGGEKPPGDEQLALVEAEKADGRRKELLQKSRSELLQLAKDGGAALPILRSKVSIVDAILKAESLKNSGQETNPQEVLKDKISAELQKSTAEELRNVVDALNKGLPITNPAAGVTIKLRQQLQQFQPDAPNGTLIDGILGSSDFSEAKPI